MPRGYFISMNGDKTPRRSSQFVCTVSATDGDRETSDERNKIDGVARLSERGKTAFCLGLTVAGKIWRLEPWRGRLENNKRLYIA